jgi:anti-sigma regulatory factor (Ser/Thr protein kinase)
METSLTIRASLAEVDRARAFLAENLRGLPLSDDDKFQLDLALVEVCVNVSRYAYPDGQGEIRIVVSSDEAAVRLEIRDHGLPFDPRDNTPPSLEVLLRGEQKGGLGIHLTRTFTDGFDYRREGAENVLTLTKSLSR